MNNVRQIGLAYSLYVADWGMPDFRGGRLLKGDWLVFLAPYHSDSTEALSYFCPATRHDPTQLKAWLQTHTGYGTADQPFRLEMTHEWVGRGKPSRVTSALYASYGINNWSRAMDSDRNLVPLFFRNESAVTQPSLTPIFADSGDVFPNPMPHSRPARDLYYDGVEDGSAMNRLTLARHGGRGTAHSSLPVAAGQPLGPYVNNIAFFDGHVSPVKLDNLWKLYWHAQWEPPAVRPP